MGSLSLPSGQTFFTKLTEAELAEDQFSTCFTDKRELNYRADSGSLSMSLSFFSFSILAEWHGDLLWMACVRVCGGGNLMQFLKFFFRLL